MTSLLGEAQALVSEGRWLEAVARWRQLIDLDSQDAGLRVKLGLSLARAGLWLEAIDAYGEAFRLGLAEDEVLLGLGLVFCMRDEFNIARENLERAVSLNPNNLAAWSNLVVTYARLGLVEQATLAAEQVLTLRPDDAPTLSALGTLCKDAGMPNEAVAWFQRAIAAAPDDIADCTNLLWAMLHSDAATPAQIVTEARRFNARVNRGLKLVPEQACPHPVADKLRIGWVSGDLRLHPVGFFVIPVIEQLGPGFESFVYSTSRVCDEMTVRAQHAVSAWRDLGSLGDAQVVELIRSDRIDILIDLSGHTGGNKLSVFARRAAPIQASWLGFPGTSGLQAMDFIFVPPDPVLLAGAWCTETPIALADCYYVLDPFRIPLPVAASAPHEKNGFITFGCLNNFSKVSPSAIHTWARILEGVPDARLIMVATGGNDQMLITDIRNRFANLGIDPARLTIHGRLSYDDYLAAYRDIDIALDPFPFNGGTTGIDCLYMGTPFITLQGEALHARLGGNLLNVLGLQELISSSMDEYTRIATSLAGNKPRLQAIRSTLRSTMQNSPLMDIGRFTRGMEQVFLEMRSRQMAAPRPELKDA